MTGKPGVRGDPLTWPVTEWGEECPQPPHPVPAEVPTFATCLWNAEADLDGNGRLDRLVTWQVEEEGAAPSNPVPDSGVGAVAYFDDHTHRQLERGRYDERYVLDLVPHSRVDFDGNGDEEVVLRTALGANTVSFVIADVTENGEFRVATLPDGEEFGFSAGGGVAYGSAFGCVTALAGGAADEAASGAPPSGGRLLALEAFDTSLESGKQRSFVWDVEYYRLIDAGIHHLGTRGGYRVGEPGEWIGTDQADSCAVGAGPPAIVSPPSPAGSASLAVEHLVGAALAGEETTGRFYVAGLAADPEHGIVAQDPWTAMTAIRDARRAGAPGTARCRDIGSRTAFCRRGDLYFSVTRTDLGSWAVNRVIA